MIEYALLGRALPSLKSLASLLMVSLGAAAYCMADSQLGGGSYGWVVAYFFLITIEMTYGKSLTSSVKMDSVWGPVLYVNTLSILPMAMLGAGIGDFTVCRGCVEIVLSRYCGTLTGQVRVMIA